MDVYKRHVTAQTGLGRRKGDAVVVWMHLDYLDNSDDSWES